MLTPEQARTHPRRNVVTRALGSAPVVLADHWLLPVIGGDRFLICSDGLFGELLDGVMAPLLAIANPQQAAEALVAAANDSGGRDNITALVVDIESAEAPEFRPVQAPAPREESPARPPAPGPRPAPAPGPAERGGTGGGGAGGGAGGTGELPIDVGLAGLGLIGPDPDRRDR